MSEQGLDGGIVHAGEVVRDGRHVLRPSSRHTPSVHAFLRSIRAAGFAGAPWPVGVDADGRERLEYVEGDVALSPYPAWAQTDGALASIAELVRGLHDAAARFDPRGHSWDTALADPAGGTIVCHNDVELSNVVFRGGVAIALLDFEFAAPGRPVYDLAHLARLCVPLEHAVDRQRMGWTTADHPARLRIVADAYGLDREGRAELIDAIDDALATVEAAARDGFGRGVARATIAAATGGMEKYHRRRVSWARRRRDFATALR